MLLQLQCCCSALIFLSREKAGVDRASSNLAFVDISVEER